MQLKMEKASTNYTVKIALNGMIDGYSWLLDQVCVVPIMDESPMACLNRHSLKYRFSVSASVKILLPFSQTVL